MIRIDNYNNPNSCRMSYETRTGQTVVETMDVSSPFSEPEGSSFAQSVRKGILLTRYVNMMKHWITETDNGVSEQNGISPYFSTTSTTTRENSSDSGHFKKMFKEFHKYFMEEYEELDDESLLAEAKMILAVCE